MLYIEKIEINSFGCISDKVFSFDKGFNLVFGNNESGKTTLLSFVLFAFYGTKIKKQPGDLSFKDKYMPWNGKPMQGSITFEYGNQAYCISRLYSDARNTVNLININSGEHIKDRHILASPGEYFFGVSADTFANSVFFTSGGANIKNSSNQEMADLLCGTFENTSSEVSYNQISDILSNEILNLSSSKRKSAVIPKLEAEIYEICQKQAQIKKSIIDSADIESKIKKIEQEILCEETEIAKIKASCDAYDCGSVKKNNKLRNFVLLFFLLFVLSLGVAIAFPSIYTSFVCKVFVLLLITSGLVFLVSKKKEERHALRKVFTLQQNNDKIILLTQNIIELNNEKMRYMDMIRQNSELDAKSLQLDEKKDALKFELLRFKDELAALELAKKALDNAYSEFKTIFSPELSALTADYFSRITMKKYQKVSVDDAFDISVAGVYGYKTVAALSHGSKEQAYLAMRLAFSDIVFSKKKIPVFLDDPFSFYDDKRLESTIEFLIELSKNRQIIFSTCRSSEYSLITEHNVKVLYF